MKAGDRAWMRSGSDRHLADVHGEAIIFRVTAIQTLPGRGTWYRVHTSHAAAQEIFGGWRSRLSLAPVPLTELTKGVTHHDLLRAW
ncbi:hypothetical protein [Streptomyces yunnanensis]|uniref:Uncharacterized protein n=1 Tax=Streptomyces yunnanensis TaxID=156453 RepID=A0A9X8N5N7_9ACTN|nr:hypothetical protein [Streptomyces yunnanensis]SHN08913.1 hypothetical protein SAMN05216268_119109 [Streptomyces yunnanensis]